MTYYNSQPLAGPRLTPPPTPHKSHKRSRDDYEESYSTIKRAQSHQIHSQEHLTTVQMMMEASRQQKYQPMADISEVSEEQHEVEPVSTPQKPFWPIVTRVRQT
ncbi:hypothetical protein JCM33374_g5194 [Metschnikowia sp. JCM 33374]|nr:hypothetical protein JCM33374_g5194 [Metschnikowia sp. JCM 33374]